MRERFPNASNEQRERFFQRIQQIRDLVIKKGQLQTDAVTKDTYQGDIYVLEAPQRSFYVMVEDTPNTVDKVLKQDDFDLLFALTTQNENGDNLVFDLYINGTFAIDILLASEIKEEEPLHYTIDTPIPLSQIKPYEIDLVASYLDQISPPLP